MAIDPLNWYKASIQATDGSRKEVYLPSRPTAEGAQPTDPTLSVPGMPADAAEAGKYLYALAFPTPYTYNADTLGLKQGSGNAEYNSGIWEAFIVQNSSQNNRCVHFPSGGWYFARPVNFGGLACVYGDGIPTYSKSPTRLYANADADGEAAFVAVNTSLMNISLNGDDSKQHYSLAVARDKLLTDPNSVFVESWDSVKAIGLLTRGTVHHRNVAVNNFYVGVYAQAGNVTLDSFYVSSTHTAIVAANDCYVLSSKIVKSMIGLETVGNLANTIGMRGDSIGLHLIKCLHGGLDADGIDADFCMGSIIHFGGESTLDDMPYYSNVPIGTLSGVRGRAAVHSSYDRDEAYTMQGKPTDRCSLVSFEENTEWQGGVLDIATAAPSNPLDYASRLRCPAAEMCIPSTATLSGTIIRTNNQSWASADLESIQREHLRIDSPGSSVTFDTGRGSWRCYRDESGFKAERIGEASEPRSEWQLKGTITNPTERITVDLSGCTEMAIKGSSAGTGISTIRDPNSVLLQISQNGTMNFTSHFINGFSGFECISGRCARTDPRNAGSVLSAYSALDGKTISEINTLFLLDPQNVTSCNIEIWGR